MKPKRPTQWTEPDHIRRLARQLETALQMQKAARLAIEDIRPQIIAARIEHREAEWEARGMTPGCRVRGTHPTRKDAWPLVGTYEGFAVAPSRMGSSSGQVYPVIMMRDYLHNPDFQLPATRVRSLVWTPTTLEDAS